MHLISLRNLTSTLLAAVIAFMAFAPTLSLAGETIGTISKKRNDVYGTVPGDSRERKFPRYDVYLNELIETSGGAAVLVRLDDETELYLGERSSLVLDDFVYEPGGKHQQATYNFTLGTLRFVSGDMDETHVVINTPSAQLGIRGSEAVIFVTPTGATIVNVIDGVFSVSSKDTPGAPPVEVQKGQNVTVARGTPVSEITPGVQLPDAELGTVPSTTQTPISGSTSSSGDHVVLPDYATDFSDISDGGSFDTSLDGDSHAGGGYDGGGSDDHSSSGGGGGHDY